ncbi:hypothetical protein I2I11_08055 [Pontibacter sp. 172403-2]|uniref:condensin complex protein MksE n=1 Tax=Pontibacter rufus TaxID=2791028 RepID=UPI0018AFA0EF|nr:hypothetical protein [Pontibacter sp. 172403-2]MBF9253241.1 hypothetical protein [Pontibacter sp. 172403-2]
MEDESKQNITRTDFLQDKKVDQVFAKIDYLLRSGVHIQYDYPLPGELFRFIERNFDSLTLYYQELFMVKLEKGGANLGATSISILKKEVAAKFLSIIGST